MQLSSSVGALERAGRGVEDGDATVAVAIRDEQLVGGRVHLDIGRAVHVTRVGVPLAFARSADLQHELAVLRELQNLIVGHWTQVLDAVGRAVVAGDPNEALMVDKDAMLALDPLVAGALAAPRPDEVPRRVEHDDGRGGHLRLLGLEQRPRPV